jgi:sugar transferase EpsL
VGLKIKRAVDVITASLALVVLAPAFALIALAIWLESGAPVLFRQTRVGHRGRRFTIYKFRTMRLRAGGALTVTKVDPRLTKLGYWLRTFSLDELPQFVNVLRGDMSLVGPRPLLPEQMAPIVRDHPRRLDMLPGMTNLPAIHGRNSLGFQERMALDVWYVEHWTPMLDCRIVLKTLWIIMRGAGVYASAAPRN